MQSTQSGKGLNPTSSRRTQRRRPTFRRVLREPQMSSVLVLVADVLSHQTLQMPRIEDDDVIQQVSSATADPTLSNAVLPWATKRRSHGAHSDIFRERNYLVAKLRVAVEQ